MSIEAANVSLSHLRKVFVDAYLQKEIVAVEDFSLEIKKGELVTLLGPSGCGKTTVLRMLAGFENPTSGRILLNSKDITYTPPHRRNSAMVFQSYALFPHMSVEENIRYGLTLRSISKDDQDRRVQKMLETVNLIGFEKRRPNELSGGQQQRVALARALIVEPSILLFDEPLSNLDAKLRESMRNEIRSLQKALSITAVYVTHDQSEAMAISDRVVVMNRARIEQIGTPNEVYGKPSSKFVADFMGAANFIPTSLVPLVETSIGFCVIRPENLRFGVSDHALQVIVREYHFLGAYHEYHLETEDHLRLVARVANGSLDKIYQVGDRASVTFDDRHIHLVSQ